MITFVYLKFSKINLPFRSLFRVMKQRQKHRIQQSQTSREVRKKDKHKPLQPPPPLHSAANVKEHFLKLAGMKHLLNETQASQ